MFRNSSPTNRYHSDHGRRICQRAWYDGRSPTRCSLSVSGYAIAWQTTVHVSVHIKKNICTFGWISRYRKLMLWFLLLILFFFQWLFFQWLILFISRKWSLRQGNIFTGVCLSMGSLYDVTSCLAAWSHIPSRSLPFSQCSNVPSRGSLSRERVSVGGCLCREIPQTQKSGRYASHWNAFLFHIWKDKKGLHYVKLLFNKQILQVFRTLLSLETVMMYYQGWFYRLGPCSPYFYY